MADIALTSAIIVQLVQQCGGDRDIAAAAWVTTRKDADAATEEEVRRVLRMCLKCGHGSVFEFGSLVFDLHVPLFVLRQWQRSRIGWSYSELSGRWHRPGAPLPYEPLFWFPQPSRPMVPMLPYSPTRPAFTEAGEEQYLATLTDLRSSYAAAWFRYEQLLARGIASEVARAVLPLATYTRCRVQCNPRSLLLFLSKRTKDPTAAVPSYPQDEIADAARQCEEVFRQYWPWTHAAWIENGRVAH